MVQFKIMMNGICFEVVCSRQDAQKVIQQLTQQGAKVIENSSIRVDIRNPAIREEIKVNGFAIRKIKHTITRRVIPRNQ
ncbi:MAG: hypothetical protein KDC71_23260 [Acidobacteria bacterium]|nr:hypothetical protein [Acidobacteriota bacterium]